MQTINKFLSFFLFFTLINSSLFCEVGTTHDPKEYAEFEVISVEKNGLFQLEDGSLWQIKSNKKEDIIHVGDKVHSPTHDFSTHVVATSSSGKAHSVPVKLVDLPYTERNVVERIQVVYWAGEIQALVTLQDGSVWMSYEGHTYRVTGDWKPGHRIMFSKLRNNSDIYFMHDVDSIDHAIRIEQYTIKKDYEILDDQEVK